VPRATRGRGAAAREPPWPDYLERSLRFEVNGRTGLLCQPSVLLLATLVMLVAHPRLSVRRLPAENLAVTGQVVVIALPGRHVLGEFVRVSREGARVALLRGGDDR
jgi:hypothetical protein